MNADDVIAWREALVRLSDQHFFDLMRMYLGAIKTPFNKQRLIEELSSFLRKKENRSHIIMCLDTFDLLVLSALHELPSPTQPKIIKLFSGSYSFPEMYERILNLEERLIIYRKSDTENREYAINPLLETELLPLIGMGFLVPPESRGEAHSAHLRIDDLSLAALYSFFLHESEAVKNDGSFRKKTISALETIFPQLYTHPDCLPLLLAAFQNMGLLVKLEGRLVPDPERWLTFAQGTAPERVAYLVAAAGGRFQRDTLQQRAQVFLDFFRTMDSGSLYKKETISRMAFLLTERTGHETVVRPHGRFATLLREKEVVVTAGSVNGGNDYADIAFAFGLLLEKDGLWTPNAAAFAASAGSASKPCLIVSPSFTVTLMPGFTLAELLPLSGCMEVRDIQIAGQFEITRKSCAAAFDLGSTAETLAALLKSKSVQAVPQNVVFSLQDWYRNYSSVSLYHGFVLRVDESRRVLFENNKHLSTLIRKILAPGIYLLDAESAEEIQEVFTSAELDFLPAVSTPVPKREAIPLPALRVPSARNDDPVAAAVEVDETTRLRYQTELLESLEALKLGTDLHEALKSRIERRIVLTSAQLDPESVKIEKVEARGMDFLGKIRIAEYALASGSMLEVVLDEKDGNRLLLGRPLSTEKRTGDVLLKIQTEPDLLIEQVSLGKAVSVRRIRGSIFSELPGGRA